MGFREHLIDFRGKLHELSHHLLQRVVLLFVIRIVGIQDVVIAPIMPHDSVDALDEGIGGLVTHERGQQTVMLAPAHLGRIPQAQVLFLVNALANVSGKDYQLLPDGIELDVPSVEIQKQIPCHKQEPQAQTGYSSSSYRRHPCGLQTHLSLPKLAFVAPIFKHSLKSAPQQKAPTLPGDKVGADGIRIEAIF